MHFGQKRHEPIAYLMINMYIGKVSESMKTCHKMEILDVATTLPTHRALWENFLVYLQGTLYTWTSTLEKMRNIMLVLKSGRDFNAYL